MCINASLVPANQLSVNRIKLVPKFLKVKVTQTLAILTIHLLCTTLLFIHPYALTDFQMLIATIMNKQ